MLSSKILKNKNTITKGISELTDMIYSTFLYPKNNQNVSITEVSEYENMRPDLIANTVYADHNKWDVLLKYNGISNPFSLKTGDVLYVLPYSLMDASYIKPRKIEDREQLTEIGFKGITGASDKDSDRVSNLVKKKGAISPNLNKEGDKNVKIKDGKLIFGEDVTTINKKNCPVPISRSRLKTALLKDKLFL